MEIQVKTKTSINVRRRNETIIKKKKNIGKMNHYDPIKTFIGETNLIIVKILMQTPSNLV